MIYPFAINQFNVKNQQSTYAASHYEVITCEHQLCNHCAGATDVYDINITFGNNKPFTPTKVYNVVDFSQSGHMFLNKDLNKLEVQYYICPYISFQNAAKTVCESFQHDTGPSALWSTKSGSGSVAFRSR